MRKRPHNSCEAVLLFYKLMLMIFKIMSKSYQSHAYDLSNS